MGYDYNYLKAENWSGDYGIGYWGGSMASGGDNPSILTGCQTIQVLFGR